MTGCSPVSHHLHKVPHSQHLQSSSRCGLGFPEGRCRQEGAVGARSGKEPAVLTIFPFPPALCRAMSHQILLLLAVLTLGLATSQHRDKVPCRKVRCSASSGRAPHIPCPPGVLLPQKPEARGLRRGEGIHLMPLNPTFNEHLLECLNALFTINPAK